MTAGAHGRADWDRDDDTHAWLAAGGEVPLCVALFDLTDADCTRHLSALLANLVGKVLAGELVALALDDDPFAARRPVQPGALRDATLVPGDPDLSALRVLGGRTIRDVHFRRDDLHQAPADVTAINGEQLAERDAGLPAALPIAAPGAMAAAARWLVIQDRRFEAEGIRSAFATFGVELTPDGQSIDNPPDTIDGAEKDSMAGRRPSVARLLIEARGRHRIEEDPANRHASAAALARDVAGWIAANFPSVVLPAPKTIGTYCGQLVERRKQ